MEIKPKIIGRINSFKYFKNGDIGLAALMSNLFLPCSARSNKINQEIIAARARHIGVYQDDVFLISFPHSGRTWLTYLLANIKRPNTNWIERNYIVPDYSSNLFTKKAKDISRPRVFVCHNGQHYAAYYSKMVYLYRDGRDVAVSIYKTFRRKRRFKGSFREFIKMYIKEDFDNSISWHKHIKQNLFEEDSKEIMSVRYEDLCANTLATMKTICSFIGISATDKIIENAIAQGSFESYQKFTNNLGAKGRPGAWKSLFDKELHSYYWTIAGETLTKLGYSK